MPFFSLYFENVQDTVIVTMEDELLVCGLSNGAISNDHERP